MYGVGFGRTDTGRHREHNEDSFHVDNLIGFYVVCDGMGGHAAGEVASETAVVAATARVLQYQDELKAAIGTERSIEVASEILERAVHTACATVFERATASAGRHGMGTTFVAMLVMEKKVLIAHVGDSRAYLLRCNNNHQLTADHTIVNELVQRGVLTPEQARHNPHAHVLSRALGLQPRVEVDILPVDILEGDRFVLCSDGLSNYLKDAEHLADLVEGELDGLPSRLVDFACTEGGRDNVTAVVIDIHTGEDERGTAAEHSTELEIKLDALSGGWLFQDLAFAHVSQLLQVCKVEQWESGELVVTEGEEVARLYIVLFGALSVLRAGEELATLGAGATLGETSLLRPRVARATLKACKRSSLLRLDASRIKELMQRRPFLGMELLGRLTTELSDELERSRARRQREAKTGFSERTAGDEFF